MTDIFAMCQPDKRQRGNNLAEGLAKTPGAGIHTFDICGRAVDGQGNLWLWASFQRSVSTLGNPDYLDRLDDDAKALLAGAVTITPDMLGPDGVLPAIGGKFVIAPGISPQAVLSAYGLANADL